MKPDPQDLQETLASYVLEGRDVDWAALESTSDPSSLGIIRQYKAIAEIAGISKRITTDTPKFWGHLRIEERIGAGAFGEVFRAWDSRLERIVALKLLRRDRDPTAMLREARLLARIRHPNIVTIFDTAEFEGRAGFWMEFVEGRTLEEAVCALGAFGAEEVRKMAIQLCSALAAVHAAGLLHRDVKAQNVIRTAQGRLVLMDFGAGDELTSPVPASQQSVGTPLYLAPEILSGGAATQQSEIYSLGVLLFRIATRSYPVLGATSDELRAAHQKGARGNVLEVVPDLPGSLARVIDRALDPDPGYRFETVLAMETALADESPQVPLVRRMKVTPVRMTLPVAVLLLILVSGALVFMNRIPTETPAAALPLSSPPAIPSVPSNVPSQVQSALGDRTSNEAKRPPEVKTNLVTVQMLDAELQRRVNLRTLGDDGVHATCTRGLALGICNLTTGSFDELRVAAGLGQGAGKAVLSPDATRVAYVWTDTLGLSLRVIRSDGTGDLEIYRPAAGVSFSLEKWIQDGRAVLITAALPSQPGFSLVAVMSDGGRTDELWRFDGSVLGIDLTQDERFIVFARAAPGQATRDLGIIDRRTGTESWLYTHPSDDAKPIWTPDGHAVLFLSDRLGSSGLFALPVNEGQAAGDAVLVRDLGRSSVDPVNVTRDGTLFLRMTTHWVDAYRASVDLDKGVMGLPERLDTRSIEDTTSPDWGPGGHLFAYVSGPIGRARDTKARLLVRHTDGRLEREVPLEQPLGRAARMRWSPDGQYVALRYAVDNASSILHLIDVKTGASRPLITGLTGSFEWSNDGASIYYNDGRSVQRHDIDTGTASALSSGRFLFAVSPQDGSLALGLPSDKCPVTISGPGNGPRAVVRRQFDYSCFALTWSRDGRKVLVSMNTLPEEPGELWVMDASTGNAVRIAVPETEAINSLSLAPGDHELLFSAGNPRPQYWTLRGAGSTLK